MGWNEDHFRKKDQGRSCLGADLRVEKNLHNEKEPVKQTTGKYIG